MENLFITEKQAQALTASLKSALLTNKKAVDAIDNNDWSNAAKYSKKVQFKLNLTLQPIALDLAKALTKTKVDGEGPRSTALGVVFSNLWTVGTFGSVFVDVKVHGEGYRVHFIAKNSNTIFFVEQH